MTARNIFWNRRISIKLIAPFLLSFTCLLLLGFILSGSASAETDLPIAASAPTPNSGTTDTGADFTPLTGVGQGAFDGTYMWYKVYVKNGQSATVVINQTCADSIGNPSVSYSLESLTDAELDYGGGNPGNIYPIQTITSGNCASQLSFRTISTTDGIASAIPGHTTYRTFAVYAQMNPVPAANAEQYFSVTTTNNANTYVGMSRPDVTNNKVLRFSTIYRASGTWSASVMFAPRCTLSGNNAVNIQIYDPDNGIYQNNMQANLQTSPRGGPINWSPGPAWDANYVQGGAAVWGQSNTTSTESFTADGSHIYKFHITDSSHPNTIQLKLPFDQFDATPEAQAGCNNPNPPPPPPPPPTGTNGQCNIVTQPVRTEPGQPVNFAVRITNLGGTTLASPAIKLYITGPAGVTGSFNIPTVPAATAQDMTVSIINVPTTAADYPNYRTYRLGYSQTNTFGGSCSPTLRVGTVTHGDLIAASCQAIVGHVWTTESDTGVTVGRLHITAPGIDLYTAQFITAYTQPHSSGGHWFAIDPYQYNPSVPPGPSIDVLLHYRDKYTITLQVPDGPGVWYDAASTPLEYPCLTGNMDAQCTAVAGSLYFKSSSTTNITGAVSADGFPNPPSFQAHYGYSVDPFNSVQMGTQILPHTGHDFRLFYWDTDSSGPWAVPSNDGSAQVTGSIPACLTFSGCSPSPVTFEVTGSTTQTFTMGYTNNTLDNFPGYYGIMNSTDTVRINGGTGPIESLPHGVVTRPPPTNNFTWSRITVSSTGAPYTGNINMYATYNGAALGVAGDSCQSIVYQVTKPYFKAFGSSVSTGGAFADSSAPKSSTCTSNPQRRGGAKAFAHFEPFNNNAVSSYVGGSNKKYGASIEYSIESLGLVQGTNTGGLGLYTGDTHDAAGDYINTLDLGDQTASWGGNLGGSHCVQDYYTANRSGNETNWSNRNVTDMFNDAGTNTDALGNRINAQAFQSSHSIVLDGGSNLPRNTRATLFVNGNVYINNNITYSGGNYDPGVTNPDGSNPTSPPYFTLIATGSIYVDPSVTQLDGLYVAQSGDGFSTCGNPSTQNSNMPATGTPSIYPDCSNKLVVNGAVVAYQLKLLRIGIDTNTLNNAGGDNGSSLVPGRHNNSVEEFNYTPNMVENFPYYICGGTCGNLGSTEKIFSLPPVY